MMCKVNRQCVKLNCHLITCVSSFLLIWLLWMTMALSIRNWSVKPLGGRGGIYIYMYHTWLEAGWNIDQHNLWTGDEVVVAEAWVGAEGEVVTECPRPMETPMQTPTQTLTTVAATSPLPLPMTATPPTLTPTSGVAWPWPETHTTWRENVITMTSWQPGEYRGQSCYQNVR